MITPEAARAGQYTLRISSAAALYEPIYALSLQASCPGTAAITRQYVLMLDLPGMTPDQASAPAQPPVTQPEQLPAALPASLNSGDALRAPVPASAPVARTPDAWMRPARRFCRVPAIRWLPATRLHRSRHASAARKVNLWTLAGQIFAANPAAFIRNDINLIKLGSTIVIPVADTTAELPGAVCHVGHAARTAAVARTRFHADGRNGFRLS